MMRFQISMLAHPSFERRQLLFVYEDGHIPNFGKIDKRREIGDACNPVLALRGQICQRRGEQCSAEAIADRVDAMLSGRRLDSIEGRQGALEPVVFKVLFSVLLVGIYPGDDEDSMSLIDGPFDERVLRLQIENIELVDPRWHDEEWPPANFSCRRRILDQLHELVLVDDFSGSRCDVFAEAESYHVSHRNRKAAISTL